MESLGNTWRSNGRMGNKACKGRSQGVGITHRKVPKKRNHGFMGKRKKALWLEIIRLRKVRACCVCGLCRWLDSFPLGECSPLSLIHPSQWFLHSQPRHSPSVTFYDKVNLTLEKQWGTWIYKAHLAKLEVHCLILPDGVPEKSFPRLLRTQHAANAATISTELKTSTCLNCQRLGLKRRVHWHIDSPGHLALDYLLSRKPVDAIPYIFLQFNEVINAIKSSENINVRKHVA